QTRLRGTETQEADRRDVRQGSRIGGSMSIKEERHMKSLLKSSILGAALAAGLGSAAHATQGVTDTEIVIGSNGDLSGPFAAFNVGAIKAAQIMFDEVNANGGIHGRKIRFVVEDHAYQVPKAVQNFNKLINSDKVFAMILNLGTPHNIA